MKFIVGLSSIGLISISSVSPCLAANQSISHSNDSSLQGQSLPSGAKTIQVAGIFDVVDKVLDTVDSERQRAEERAERKRAEQERLKRQAEAEIAEQERLKRQAEAEIAEQKRIAENQRQQLEQRTERQQREENAPQPAALPGQNSPQNINRPFPQALNKKSNETHEQWYGRINPMINSMQGTDYRAWKATLSAQDGKAYDDITERKNREAASILNNMVPAILEGVIIDAFTTPTTPTQQDCWRPDGRGNWSRC